MEVKITLRDFTAFVLGIAFINVGIDHFINPSWYEPIVPEILPDPTFWVHLSGLFEIAFGLLLIIPLTRTWASVGAAWMLIVLYWANFNMWYNDIPLNGVHYGDGWHIVRLLIQVILILVIAWIGEITPFKGKEKAIDMMDVFKGRITSSGFQSGDRIVVGSWNESIFGQFTDIMWAKPDGHRTLIAPNQKIADYVDSMYTFDEIIIQEIQVSQDERRMNVTCDAMELEFGWNKGWKIPFKRSLFFIATIELIFAKLFFSTRTHGMTRNNRKEWYAIDRVSKITDAKALIDGKNVGDFSNISEPCKFGFSEAPKKPSSCEVRTHIL